MDTTEALQRVIRYGYYRGITEGYKIWILQRQAEPTSIQEGAQVGRGVAHAPAGQLGLEVLPEPLDQREHTLVRRPMPPPVLGLDLT